LGALVATHHPGVHLSASTAGGRRGPRQRAVRGRKFAGARSGRCRAPEGAGVAMPLPAWVPIREDLRRFEPYGAPQMGDMVRLNVNENPHGPGTGLLDDIAADVRSVAAGLNRYPDREARDLRHDLAAYVGHGLSSDHMWAANGSNEIITQLFQAFAGPGRSALSFTPTYSMYPEYARDTHTRWITAPRADDFTIDVARATELISAEQPDIVLLTSPNNPTGTALPLETTRAIAESAPGIVIVDEA